MYFVAFYFFAKCWKQRDGWKSQNIFLSLHVPPKLFETVRCNSAIKSNTTHSVLRREIRGHGADPRRDAPPLALHRPAGWQHRSDDHDLRRLRWRWSVCAFIKKPRCYHFSSQLVLIVFKFSGLRHLWFHSDSCTNMLFFNNLTSFPSVNPSETQEPNVNRNLCKPSANKHALFKQTIQKKQPLANDRTPLRSFSPHLFRWCTGPIIWGPSYGYPEQWSFLLVFQKCCCIES